MAKTEEKMQNDMSASVSSIYSQLLAKRKQERDEKRAELDAQKAEEDIREDESSKTKMTKKEKRQAELDNWQTIIDNLTGDDLEYKGKKKRKKKYRKWIDDENTVVETKPKKVKKKNYQKEFEPELNMLRTILADQNKFNADLWKRWQLIMGPASKDSQVPTKTMVEMASALNAGRSNALSMLNNIGNIKKTIADLYMKQKKLDSELGGLQVADNGDIGLMGSNLAASIFGDNSPVTGLPPQNPYQEQSVMTQPIPTVTHQIGNDPTPPTALSTPFEQFDPASWQGHPDASISSKYEAIPHQIVVERNTSTGHMRFKAIREDNGEELVGCPVPETDISSLTINDKDGVVRGKFDEIYKIQNVG